MPRTKLQFSSGGVIYKKTPGRIEIILLTRGNGKIFCLPKGKIEKPETPQEAALREVREETGLEGKVEKELGKINYWFYSDEEKTRVYKTVYFFLIKYESGDTSLHDTDAEEAKWYTIENALKKMTYPSEREVVKKAKRILYT